MKSVIDGLLQDAVGGENKELAATSSASSERIFVAKLGALKQRDIQRKATLPGK
ncbi:MAG: hypothetical protein V4650_13225 [Pseudomonadota bacterium]